ncbi:DUF2236 domain-containing protein [Antrihabitans sp. YC2-6]|uniref:DUF2236 domain-containing protein n=1 Tax=Antrihabitans sp. YC2-6 TaxID=2799498 RepID=UPI0018F57B22|nr:DUF2236 domain-containing protein [Antrihabitans sp. YC2-6]MBJ8344375.1 DUF2236 domain-containing protein [Antrihabitans sp. YC2-6]
MTSVDSHLAASRRQGRRWARDIAARLDPVADHEYLTHLTLEVRYGDPILTSALYTVAFCRQMAVPSIAKVVYRGGRAPMIQATRKRNDDTMVFFGEFMRQGYSSGRGRAAISRLNQIHSRFPITNDQSLYTLASLALEPARIPAMLGCEVLTATEMDANLRFWQGVGRAMGLHDIPDTTTEFHSWTIAYERSTWAWSHGGAAVARAVIDDYAARWFPSKLQWFGRAFAMALCDDQLLAVHRLPTPPRWARLFAATTLRAYALGRRILPDPKDRSWVDYYGKAYPSHIDIDAVGYRPTEPRAS